ncbi:MAG: response regulator [Desulfobacteraceae bacterium]|jgi:DNA-binding NtrC family response regulator
MQTFQPENIRLLLVDDEKSYVDVLANRLQRRKVQVTKAYSGAEGIQLLRRNDFDVAVLDLKMEDMDGIEVLRIFKKMAPEMAVIMLTGHGSATAAQQGIQEGAFDYLTKPCELEDLLKKIAKAWAARRPPPAGE